MSDKTFGRVVIAVCLVVLLLFALTSCAAVPEVKPDIPDDLSLTCCRGQLCVISKSADRAMVFATGCESVSGRGIFMQSNAVNTLRGLLSR